MVAKVEVYSPNGELLLDSTTQILMAKGTEFPIPSINYGLGGESQNWYADWDVNNWLDAQTGAASTAGTLKYWMVSHLAKPANAQQAWYGLNEGTSLMLSASSFGVSNHGAGARVVYTAVANPNDVGGYCETYNELGELLWSVGSLAKSPAIIDVIELNGTNPIPYVYDTASLGIKKERIYFFSCYNGCFEYNEDEGGSFQTNRTVIVKRIGDKYYFRGKEFIPNNNMPATVLVAHIPA